jgi:hypothetical protein
MGAFQFMHATAKHYDIDPMHPGEAGYGAARMYADLKLRFGGNLSRMLAPTTGDRRTSRDMGSAKRQPRRAATSRRSRRRG